MAEIMKYLKVMLKWWWIMAILLVATVGTMLVIPFLNETRYEATVTVQVSAPPPEEAPLYSQFGRGVLQEEIAQNQASFNQVLMGDVVNRTVKKVPDANMGARELREHIVIEISKDTPFMFVRVRAQQPEIAADLANTLVEVGLQEYGKLRAKSTANARLFIEQELETAAAELEAAEAELIQFQIDNKIGALQNALNTQYEDIRNLRNDRDFAWAEGNVTKVQTLDQIILEREADLQNLIGLSAEYTALADGVERRRSTYNFLLEKKSEAQIKENQLLNVGYIQIITPAYPPEDPVLLIDNSVILLGAVGSILVGGLLAFLFEYLEASRAPRGVQPRAERPVALPDSAN
jgi:uncharacterized protein involved in exopolysaccharide biosynthesis